MTREEILTVLENAKLHAAFESDVEILDACMSALGEQPHWISVEERLPEKSTPVLAYKDGRIWYCERNWQSGCWESLSFAATKEYGMYWSKGPTHWMPMPLEPPEVGV